MSHLNQLPASKINSKTVILSACRRVTLAMLILAGTVLSTGCSTLPSSLSANGLFKDGAKSPVATGSQAQYLVDMQMSIGGGKKYRGTINEGTTVQSALTASGATKKFRKMDVVVMRKVEGIYKPLKMTCDYNSAQKAVRPETDYALQHGDRIVISPKSDNQLLQMLGTFADQ